MNRNISTSSFSTTFYHLLSFFPPAPAPWGPLWAHLAIVRGRALLGQLSWNSLSSKFICLDLWLLQSAQRATRPFSAQFCEAKRFCMRFLGEGLQPSFPEFPWSFGSFLVQKEQAIHQKKHVPKSCKPQGFDC